MLPMAAPDFAERAEIVDHIVSAIARAPLIEMPFGHLQLEAVFPEDLYRAMLMAMPSVADYRAMSGRKNLNE